MALQFEKNASLLDRLPIEGASENELALVEELRAAILKKRGLSEAPTTGWHAQHFTRARLVHYLRAKNGKVDSALDYLSTAIDALDGIRQKALEYESSSPLARDLADRYTPLGFYGIDYRGASVCFYKVGKHDPAGLIRETSLDFYLSLDAYFLLWYWYTLEQESLAAGMNLAGRVCIVDVSGISLSRALGLVSSFKKQNASYPGGEAPLPDGATQIWMVGLPWFIEKLFALVKVLMPASEQAKLRMLAKKDARYLEQLKGVAAAECMPPDFGGSSAELWPYGDGGDVPKTGAK